MSLSIKSMILAALLGLPIAAMAQLQVQVNLDRSRYIMFEPMVASVTLRNNSGNDLDFTERSDGTETGFMLFDITDSHNKQVKPLPCCEAYNSKNKPCCTAYTRSGHVNPAKGLYLAAGATRTIQVPLQKFYGLQTTGDYIVQARIGHRRLASDYLSKSVQFEIGSGQPLWERTTGIPSRDADGIIKRRTCSVNLFHSEQGDVIYLKIEDKNTVYALTRLGPGVKGVNPLCDFDSRARLHILLQVAPRLFRYRVYDLSGSLKEENIHLIAETVPRLHRDPDIGRVMVIGGRIAEEGIDYNVESQITMTLREIPKSLTPVGTSAPEPKSKITKRIDEEPTAASSKKSFWQRIIPGGK